MDNPNLGNLPTDALQLLSEHLGALIAGQKGELGGTSEKHGSGLPPNKPVRGQGWIEVKEIKGHRYAYRRWYDGKVKRSSYIGKAGDVMRKA
jgi:hypothetical protein